MTKSTGDECKDECKGVPALAKELGVTMPLVYKAIDAGDFQAYKFGRVVRIKRTDVAPFRGEAGASWLVSIQGVLLKYLSRTA